MGALSERKIEIVRTLVETAPDKVVGNLQQALAKTSDDSVLGGVRRLVELEFQDRTLRNTVLGPVAPMCMASSDPRVMSFPPLAFALIWRGLRRIEPDLIELAANPPEGGVAQAILAVQDKLAAIAAKGLREREVPEFRTAAELCEARRPGSAEVLASCLDIASVVRKANQRLAEWVTHPGGETSAASRLAYKDAVEIAEDAGPRFFHMLAAQMAQPWMVLRVISAVMDKPTERYLRDSELSSFGEGVLEDIDKALVEIGGLNADEGPAAGRAAAKRAELIVQQILELETCMDLQRDQGWGLRIVKQRASLASVVEGRLREADKAAIEALPMQPARNARVRRAAPKVSAPPETRLVARAITLLSFSDELRTTANYGGFSSTRAKLVEKLTEHVHHYVEEVLDLIHTGEAEPIENAAAFLEVAAEFSELLAGDKAAELVRRRAHAAIHPEAHMEAQA
ncbi:hypothetical protein [uncultured Phenylobacterium sp.]|uniref:hypothetical protein n=1 Tax=uncultured Phenylobacterium sp. TaxID=349273 RepID=UPI0025DBA859|nr:hypothetical protein [uncultured Phenylobacterium sp.]